MLDDSKLLIMIPTYNEIENVGVILARIRAFALEADVLYVDDKSPDGTGQLLDRMAAEDRRVRVLHRPGKMGVGSAHKDGIRWAYEQGYETLITMDSDQAHSPEDIGDFLKHADKADLVVGTRFQEKNSLQGWVVYRKILTHFGHFLTRHLLGLPYDATGAFRLYRLVNIPQGLFEMVESKDYAFFYESLHRIHVNKFSIMEVPIVLPVRTYGHSKMRLRDIIRGVTYLFRLALRSRFRHSSLIYVPPLPVSADEGTDSQVWDAYWASDRGGGWAIYDLIAIFYRRFIIRPAVNALLGKYFSPGSRVLHAGCGSGLVDVDMATKLSIDALDISPVALTEYARHHPGQSGILGSVSSIPAEREVYDGLFNLGVMEHFIEEEVRRILPEFNRVLKPGAAVILFWPPVWGLSVNVLKAICTAAKGLFGRDLKLHPPEFTLITSRELTERWLADAGFEMIEFSFGIRDFFTHQIIVARKIGKSVET